MSRALLLEILAAGLAAVDGTVCTARAVSRAGHERPFDLIAIGKSACAMTRGLLQASGTGLGRGLIITRRGYADPALTRDSRLEVRETGHPLPDRDSLAAGSEVLEFVTSMQTGIDVVCLISGGASSLVEAPVPGVDLEALRRANRWLLASGLDICAINAVRRRLSRIKGGGLAAALTGHAVIAYYISDVAADDPADIGSGLLKPSDMEPPSGLPAWLRALLGPVPANDTEAESVQHVIVADLDRALSACAAAAAAAGYAVSRHQSALQGDPERAAERIVNDLDSAQPGIRLWGGETTPVLPPDPGRGGRNQHLALCCARRIAGRADISILCAATDGSDGNSADAGGLVDGGTVARGVAEGFDPDLSLSRADAGIFLEASGDLVSTGPTGTNVTDLVIGLKARSG